MGSIASPADQTDSALGATEVSDGAYLMSDGRELVAHLVQDEDVVARLLKEEVPLMSIMTSSKRN